MWLLWSSRFFAAPIFRSLPLQPGSDLGYEAAAIGNVRTNGNTDELFCLLSICSLVVKWVGRAARRRTYQIRPGRCSASIAPPGLVPFPQRSLHPVGRGSHI